MIKLKLFFLINILWVYTSVIFGQNDTWTRVYTTKYNYLNQIGCQSDGGVFATGSTLSLIYSNDFGSSWSYFLPWTPLPVQGMTFTDFSVYMVNNGKKVYYSKKSGSTWSEWTLLTTAGSLMSDKNISAMTIASWGGDLLVGTKSDGVYKLSGLTWSKSNIGIENSYITCLLRSETNSSSIYAGTDSGFFKSSNSGGSWKEIGFSNQNINAIGVSNGDLIVSANTKENPVYKVHRSTNQGNDWIDITYNLPNIEVKYVAGDTDSVLYIGTDNSCYYINKNGNSWIPFNNGLLDTNIRALKYGTNGYLYVSSDSGLYRFNRRIKQLFNLTITSPNGTVSRSPNQLTYNFGSNVTLTAIPNNGFKFYGWSGDASGSVNPLSITMYDNKNITANFVLKVYSLNVTAIFGTVTKNPNQTTYNHGTLVKLKATPASGYKFAYWSGDVSGTADTVSLLMDNNKNITAVFNKIVGIESQGRMSDIPENYFIGNNYPNPFNPTTNIDFGLVEESNVSLKIYDITGQVIQTLVNYETIPAGTYKYNFVVEQLPSGIYIYIIDSHSTVSKKTFHSVKKMILLK